MQNIIEYLGNFSNRDNSDFELGKYENEIITQKRIFQQSVDDNNANKYWVYEQILSIQTLYLKSFRELKDNKFFDAWRTLDKCDLKISFLIKHITNEEKDNFWITFINDKVKKMQSIYPYKIFFSPEIIEKEKKCSICNQIISLRNHCGHDVGNLYNGEQCFRIVTKAEYVGLAVVENPVQKYSVAFLKDDKNEKDVDHYNYVVVKYLIDGLATPFEEWNVTKLDKLHPHSKFRDVGRNDKCPCGLNKKYKNCCLPKEGVRMPHYDFEFSSMTDKKHLGLKFV